MAAIACPNVNSREWKNLVGSYGKERAYRIFIANNYEIPAMNQDTFFDDLDFSEQELMNPKNFELMPFNFSASAIVNGKKSLTVRTENYKSGTRQYDGKLFNVYAQGKYDLPTYLQTFGLTKDQFIKQFLSGEEVKYQHIQDFLNGKGELFIYKLAPVRTADEIFTPTNDTRFTGSLIKKKRLLTNLKNRLKERLTDRERTNIKERIDALKIQIERLNNEDTRSLNSIMDNAFEDIQLVADILKNPNISPKDLQYSKSLLYGYTQTLEQFDVISDEDIARRNGLYGDLTDLYRLLENSELVLSDKIQMREVGKSYVSINGTEVSLGATKDIKKDTLYGFDTTRNENYIVQAITKLIKKASTTRDQVITVFQNEHKKIVANLKTFQEARGLKGDDIYDFMVQRYLRGDKKGEKSGLYVSELSADYYDALKDAKKKTPREFLTFMSSQHNFTVNEEAWKRKQKDIEEYWEDKDIQLTDKQLAARESIEDVKQKIVKNILERINPYKMKEIFDRIKQDPSRVSAQDIEFTKTFDERFGWRIGSDQILEKSPINKWIDPKYQEIMSMDKADPRRVFFEHFDKNVKEGRKELSDDEVYLPWNYIPERKKDLGLVRNFKQWWTDQISQKIAQNIHGIDPITGDPLKQIPVFTLSGKVRAEDKSYNLDSVLQSFFYETKNKKYMSEVEDDVKILQNILQKQKVYRQNPDGTPLTINGEIQYKQGTSNSYEQAQYNIAARIYAERQEKEGITEAKTYDVLDKERMAAIKKEIDDIGLSDDQKRSLNKYVGTLETYTGTNPYSIRYIELATELKDLQKNFKQVTGSKLTNLGIFWTSIKSLGLNLFGGVTEVFQGYGALMIEGASKRFFSSSDAMFGIKKMIGYLSLDKVEKEKINRLSKLFKVTHSANQGLEENIVTNIAFAQYKAANFMTNNSFLLAFLKAERITDKEGKSHSLYDVIDVDENGFIILPDTFNNPFSKLQSDGNIEITERSFIMQQKFAQILKSNRDRNKEEDPILMERSAIGRILGQFKSSWMFEAFNKRIGRYREEDIYTGKDFKGFYRSFFETLFGEVEYVDDLGEIQTKKVLTLGKAIKAMWQFSFFQKYGKDGYKGELSELDQANMRMFMRELSLIAIMTGTVIALRAALSGGDPDKDYVTNKSLNYLLNQSVRIQRDLTTYMSPNSFASIVRNPAPLVSTMIDLTKITSATFDTVFGDPYAYEGTSKEYLKLPRAIEQATPALRQIRGLANKFEKQIDYTRE